MLQLILFQLPHKHKIVIAGNHEVGFDPNFGKPDTEDDIWVREGSRWVQVERPLDNPQCVSGEMSEEYKELTNCTYLEDSAVMIAGLKIYGR